MLLVVTMYFDPFIHGSLPEEEKYIEFMKFKHLVLSDINYTMDDTVIELVDWISDLETVPSNLRISIISSTYMYRERCFAVVNRGIDRLQLNYKTYYKRKMAHYKNPRNIMRRHITGSFPPLKSLNYS